MTDNVPKALPPNTITRRVRFEHTDLRGTHTDVQSVAVLTSVNISCRKGALNLRLVNI